jgi:hypothetical protein
LLFSEVSVSMCAVRYEGLVCISYALLAWNHLVTAWRFLICSCLIGKNRLKSVFYIRYLGCLLMTQLTFVKKKL